MIGLRIEYKLNGESHVLECDTIMDFIKAVEDGDSVDGTDVLAIFWENKLITYRCGSLHRLYEHCKEIVA